MLYIMPPFKADISLIPRTTQVFYSSALMAVLVMVGGDAYPGFQATVTFDAHDSSVKSGTVDMTEREVAVDQALSEFLKSNAFALGFGSKLPPAIVMRSLSVYINGCAEVEASYVGGPVVLPSIKPEMVGFCGMTHATIW